MDWEFSLLYALQELHNPVLDAIMLFITSLGDDGWFWIAIGVVCLVFKKHRKMGIQLLLSMLCTFILGNLIIKNLVARPRPCDIDATVTLLLSRPHGHSFPSGHSINSMVAAVALYLNNRKIGIPAMIIATLIGFSRLYLFVHFPTDVLGGFVIAAFVAIGVDWALLKFQTWRARRV
ncbi:MAG: phosphatase PAP2 family protein [Agathobacter sp.]|nr:phosphatase PAP2 family protein [Agathobacter sp.]